MSRGDARNGTVSSETSYEKVRALVTSLVGDGNLSDEDTAEITAAVDDLASIKSLTRDQRKEILALVRQGVAGRGGAKVPLSLKVFGAISLVVAGILLFLSVQLSLRLVDILFSGTSPRSTTELVLILLQTALTGTSCILQCVLAVRLLRNNRYGAALMVDSLAIVTLGVAFLSIMLNGVGMNLVYLGIILALQSALGTYLSPSLTRERKLSGNLRKTDTKYRALNGTLGLDLEGPGYIKLDFFNLFWVFIVGCVAGLVVEVVFHMVFVDPGVYQDRAGLLWGPFSPIYGFGCVLMTVALNRFKDAPVFVVFVVCTLIGGAFEYLVSLWMEISFGAVAWDYSDRFLNIQGRTCLLFASMFGVLGLVWIRFLLPRVLGLINKIPWKARYAVTTVCAVFMLVNCVMTVQALDCWYERCAGKPVVSDVQKYYAEHFPDDVMQNRFQTMTINPDGGHSGDL